MNKLQGDIAMPLLKRPVSPVGMKGRMTMYEIGSARLMTTAM